ncbi:MAG: AbrB/MazE/SpoVT family DNA-binding domain-containing protein [Candidatus Methanoperedens sp.]|nr:AbrB/MazE/SpoVT family DNA-binding domain-containing protein [Candidatus Methanoperedens sp.]MCZ7370733.1 AbrB/MazE/SpoVT family DNA-binding domain-containing protein [Candidatus Methanoperedens sp.]
MSDLVKISSKGLLTLPKSIREQLNINVGDYLDVTIEAGKVILQKVDIIPKKIDWENEDKVWKEYTARRLAKE